MLDIYKEKAKKIKSDIDKLEQFLKDNYPLVKNGFITKDILIEYLDIESFAFLNDMEFLESGADWFLFKINALAFVVGENFIAGRLLEFDMQAHFGEINE